MKKLQLLDRMVNLSGNPNIRAHGCLGDSIETFVIQNAFHQGVPRSQPSLFRTNLQHLLAKFQHRLRRQQSFKKQITILLRTRTQGDGIVQ